MNTINIVYDRQPCSLRTETSFCCLRIIPSSEENKFDILAESSWMVRLAHSQTVSLFLTKLHWRQWCVILENIHTYPKQRRVIIKSKEKLKIVSRSSIKKSMNQSWNFHRGWGRRGPNYKSLCGRGIYIFCEQHTEQPKCCSLPPLPTLGFKKTSLLI